MPYGYCAMSASIVPAFSACTCGGPASNSTSFTLPDFPAALTAAVTPLPETTFIAKTPFMFGCAFRSADVRLVALVWSSLQYWVPRYLTLGYFFSSFSKPCWRWSVVLMPGLTLIPATSPEPPIALTSASAAARPPARLSVETLLNASGFVMKVSTVITGMPAAIVRLMGVISAFLSVGAIRIASGFLAMAAFKNGICVGRENASDDPVNCTFTFPSFFAADWFAAGAVLPPDAVDPTTARDSASVAITASKRRDISHSSLGW